MLKLPAYPIAHNGAADLTPDDEARSRGDRGSHRRLSTHCVGAGNG
jgi:hypothetical protein